MSNAMLGEKPTPRQNIARALSSEAKCRAAYDNAVRTSDVRAHELRRAWQESIRWRKSVCALDGKV